MQFLCVTIVSTLFLVCTSFYHVSAGPLCDALAQNHWSIKAIEYHLDVKGGNIEETDHLGNRPLHIAIENLRFKIVEYLLKKGANVDAQNNEGDTPLHTAVRLHSYKLVDFLLRAGASMSLQNNLGKSALYLATKRTDYKIIDLLIDTGADPDVQDLDGNTPRARMEKRLQKKVIWWLRRITTPQEQRDALDNELFRRWDALWRNKEWRQF